MSNPIGLHVQAQTKSFNRQAFINHVKAADYTTVTILDDLQLAIDLHIPYAVFRSYGWEPQPKGNDEAAGHEAADIAFGQLVGWRNTQRGSENVLFMLNCERGFGLGVSWMYAHLIERCASEVNTPIGLCLGNWASGAVKCGQAGEPNAWIDAAEPLLRALVKHKDKRLPNGSQAFVIGNHDYTSTHPWIAVNGGQYEQKPLWKDRPLAIDWSLPQWHLGRMIQGMMAACRHFGIAGYPPVIITECLLDNMNDVADRIPGLKLAPGYDKPRGWRSLVPQHQLWYGSTGWDAASGETYAHMLQWVWETIYEPLGFVVGMHVYCYGNTGDWVSFQVDNAPGYLKAMEAYRPSVVTPPAPVAIAADDPRWERYTALAKGNVVSNIRALPNTNAAIVGTLESGITTNIRHIPLDKLTDVEKVYSHDVAFRWWAVMLVDRIGWIRSDVVTLTPAVIVLPPPEPEPPDADTVCLPTETAQAVRERLGKRSNSLKDVARGLLQEAAELDALIEALDKAIGQEKAA